VGAGYPTPTGGGRSEAGVEKPSTNAAVEQPYTNKQMQIEIRVFVCTFRLFVDGSTVSAANSFGGLRGQFISGNLRRALPDDLPQLAVLPVFYEHPQGDELLLAG